MRGCRTSGHKSGHALLRMARSPGVSTFTDRSIVCLGRRGPSVPIQSSDHFSRRNLWTRKPSDWRRVIIAVRSGQRMIMGQRSRRPPATLNQPAPHTKSLTPRHPLRAQPFWIPCCCTVRSAAVLEFLGVVRCAILRFQILLRCTAWLVRNFGFLAAVRIACLVLRDFLGLIASA